MTNKITTFSKSFLKTDLPDLRSGCTVRVYQKVKEGKEEKTQVFEGLIIARKHGKEVGSTITVKRIVSGVGVERIFPLHSPLIEKIEILNRGKTRRAKLYYLRRAKGRKAKLKKRDFTKIIGKEKPDEIKEEEQAVVENTEKKLEIEEKKEDK